MSSGRDIINEYNEREVTAGDKETWWQGEI